jgi:selenocysteine-specific elongation factor
LEQLAVHHAENPDQQGIGREKLRLLLQPRLPALIFVIALKRVAANGELVLDGAFVRLAAHAARLAAGDEVVWRMIAPLLGGAERFRPPRVRDIAEATGRRESDVRRLLKLAGRLGWVDEVAHDHFFLRATLSEMTSIVAEVAAQAKDSAFAAAEFRDRLANGRKVAIQILDFFDRHGVTLRMGDLRKVNKHRLDLFGPVMLSTDADGGESSLVGRSDFKSEWGSEPVSGGFDSRSLPPAPSRVDP